MKIQQKDTWLFLGDSITDCDRDRQNPFDLGHGFAQMTAEQLTHLYPDSHFTFYNRGIGGNQSHDVLVRLQEDCLDLTPDVVVFLIGINDTWHHVGDADFGTAYRAQRFEETVRQIVAKITESGITRILLLEPFLLPYPADRKTWRIDLDPKIHIIRQLAAEYHCQLVPLDGLFAEAAVAQGPQALTGEDGVHPTMTGHQLITHALLARLTYAEET